MSLTEIIAASAGVAQVITASVALYLLFRANRVNQDTHFVGHTVNALLDAAAQARRVRRLHAALFESFSKAADKVDARSEWLREREDVAAGLNLYRDLTEDLDPVWAAWTALEDYEDTHVRDGKLKVDPTLAKQAQAQYDTHHQKFLTTIAEAIRQIRKNGLKHRRRKES